MLMDINKEIFETENLINITAETLIEQKQEEWKNEDEENENKLTDEDREKNEEERDNEIEEIKEDCHPMMNYIHPLQNIPTEEDILNLHEKTSNVCILQYQQNQYFIGLVGAGWDMSEHIAYAYYIIDRHIPTRFTELLENKEPTFIAKELFYEMKNFLNRQNIK